MKLSKAPNMRTVIIAVLAFILVGTAADAFAKELRVTTAADLVNCVTGVALASGPDAGKVAAAGDTCVVFPGTYTVAAPVDIVIENLTLRSTNGATATIIQGQVNIVNRGVTVGGPAPDQGFTITNPGGIGICVTDPANALCAVVATGGQAANENITIQNNTIRQNANEGILFTYTTTTAIDTIRILKNRIENNGGDGIAFDNNVGAIGRRGLDRNVVIEGNFLNDNGNGANIGVGAATSANIHFYNTTTIEQLAIINNEIYRAGVTVPQAPAGSDGILFDGPITEIRDTLIDRNLIQFNTRNGIKFDYVGRLGENVTISNNKGVTPEQGITHNGPAAVPGEGNGIYITGLVNDVRDLRLINNSINSNRGWDGTFPPAPAADLDGNGFDDPCRHGNGLAIEADSRVESLLLDGNDFRQNFNNGVCIANDGDFTRSQILNNKFHNNGVGDYINSAAEAPYGDGFGVYHDVTINGATVPAVRTEGFRIEDIVFRGNDYRENGGDSAGAVLPAGGSASLADTSSLGFGVFLRNERAEISRITFENETAIKNFLGGFRLETDTDQIGPRSGDIREITWTNVTSSEGQGQLNIGFAAPNDYDVGDNGDGIALITDNGDIDRITYTNVIANNNGSFGIRVESDASAGAKPEATGVTAGDIDSIAIKDSTVNFNGTRAAVGRGSGILVAGDSVRNVTVNPTEASSNNDHGVQVTGTRNVSGVTIENSTFNNNDRNRDTVGDGVQVNANEDLSNVVIRGVTANGNYAGIRTGAAGRQIAQNITIENVTANNNAKEGIALFAGRDIITALVKGSRLSGNGIGISVEVIERGTGISIEENQIRGANGLGVGILLNSSGVSITKNNIRNNAVGIEVRKARESKANFNNIARNETFGVDASALAPGEEFDATNNWWGEPSGPKAADNPGGIGDKVSQKVKYRPFLGEPALPPETDFVVESLTVDKTDVTVGDTVTFNYVIKNQGLEEGVQEVRVVIKDGLGNVVNQFSRQITVNPAGSRVDSFSFLFQTPGAYTITVSVEDSLKSVTVTVAGEAACLPFALDNNPKNSKLDDPEIITAIDLWVKGGAVPGCVPPVTISDTQIIQLIDLWVKQSQLTVPLGGKLTSLNATLSVASTFATLGASVRQVRPGESFTVTVSVDAKDGINGLLLSQTLPAGWTVKPLEAAGAYYKASEAKWLWLAAKGTVTLRYEVTVPANAQPGVYTIAGRAKAAVPSIETELQPLTVEVLGTPVALAVKSITLSRGAFTVEGAGIASTTVHVFALNGKLVFNETAMGNRVEFSAERTLANGVYLYVVTVKGANGEIVKSKINKLVVLK
ncbi:MAG: right-handed parallel beta-helix repeat-containing protein [Candidatus Bipolaricaulota bacterium]|nr:right-handed parallel beta-helix repeat-containing protein [Candidatus Bipolaricaulota bacterium]MDW8030888.1 right-handed parallel beta-helix repeat-containing protein [Candidatus Bipolaricaulota bacterium]